MASQWKAFRPGENRMKYPKCEKKMNKQQQQKLPMKNTIPNKVTIQKCNASKFFPKQKQKEFITTTQNLQEMLKESLHLEVQRWYLQ